MFDESVVKAVTPVPGGVGPMTTLLQNTLTLYEQHEG
jgi:5,10-methylene-tetrahydrofolate dehydrogenase/methenyl tetrahydrofolate cyclohydrolase